MNLSFRNPSILLAVAIIALGIGGFSFFKYQTTQAQLNDLKENPQAVAKEEAKDLVAAVGKLIDLPKEEPTVATVSDAKKLKDQPFFARAENGDKVLIFTKAKKAILYRPKTNKVIEVAPVNIGENQPQKVRVALYNGTETTGLTNTAETRLESKVAGTEVVARNNASKNDYTETVVVDLTGNSAAASAVASELGGKVGSLPSGETKPSNADILVILGSDFE